jgi:hypothetical protein
MEWKFSLAVEWLVKQETSVDLLRQVMCLTSPRRGLPNVALRAQGSPGANN